MKKYLLLSILLIWVSNVFAQAPSQAVLHPNITLSSLKAIKMSEKNGDELYLTVTEYPSSGQSTHHQFPTYPEYWPSDKLSQVSNVKIWNKDLKNGESTILVISLIEQDVPPFNPDDLIGTVRVNVKNNNGKLEVSWVVQDEKSKTIPATEKTAGTTQPVEPVKPGQTTPSTQPAKSVESTTTSHKVEFYGSDSHYEVNFNVQ